MNTLEEAKKAVIEDFSMYDEWLDKYEYLIELGKNLEPYPEENKTDDKLIKGCQSRVWLDSKLILGELRKRSREMISVSSVRSASKRTFPRPGQTVWFQ